MNGKPLVCSDQLLTPLLHADEGSAEYADALQHVELCASCRQRLESLAASKEMWAQSHEALSGDQWDQQLTHSGYDTAWQRLTSRSATSSWTDSLAKQLLQPPSHPEMLGRLGRYEIERLIGSGGMGVVFKAFDTELNRPVAIKVLAPHLAGSGAARQRFAREARAAAAVVHEHIVSIHNVESSEPAPFLVMQYVAGESLQQRIDRVGPLQIIEVLRIAMQTAAGLAAAHAQGLVHRDIKPANILLEQSVDRALLTDFGLARTSDDASLTHTGYHLGTPQYMSPEQASGETIDARSDLFSLGSVIYAMSTGRPPFRAETTLGVLRRISDHEPRPMREINAEVPEWLEHLVARLHAKAPEARFESAAELREVLEQCLAHLQQPTVSHLPSVLQIESQRDSSRWIVPVVLVALAVILGLGIMLWPQPTSQPSSSPWDAGSSELQVIDDRLRSLESQLRQEW